MADSNFLTSAIGTLVTGANPKQFTSPFRAVQVQIPLVLVDHGHSQWFVLDPAVGSDDRVDQSRRRFATQLNAKMIADDFRRVS
jgi:hypothetical protein